MATTNTAAATNNIKITKKNLETLIWNMAPKARAVGGETKARFNRIAAASAVTPKQGLHRIWAKAQALKAELS